MTSVRQLRKSALSHPAAVEQDGTTTHGVTAFTVEDTQFAAVDAGGVLHLHLSAKAGADMIAANRTAEELSGSDTSVTVSVPLGELDGQQLNYWVRQAWLFCAPNELAARARAAETAVPGEVGDLPKAIGRPATQALATAGIGNLDQVAQLTERELSAMHGVGPKAVRILREALESTGREFRH